MYYIIYKILLHIYTHTRYKYYKYCCCIRLFLNVIKVLLVYNPKYSFCFPAA